jgi:hypothetical protein
VFFFEKRTKKLLSVSGYTETARLDRESEQKFFASFFQKRSLAFAYTVAAMHHDNCPACAGRLVR